MYKIYTDKTIPIRIGHKLQNKEEKTNLSHLGIHQVNLIINCIQKQILNEKCNIFNTK